MSRIPPVTQLSPTGGVVKTDATLNSGAVASKSQGDDLRDLDVDKFLSLLIAELQNQDPLNPTDNQAILDQISTIRSIGVMDKQTNTLDSILMGQNLANASVLIGKNIDGLSADGKNITGKVDKVSILDGQPTLFVGDAKVPLTNVKEVKS